MNLIRPHLKSTALWEFIIYALLSNSYIALVLYYIVPYFWAKGFNPVSIGLGSFFVVLFWNIYVLLGYGISRLYVLTFNVWALARKQTQRLKAGIFRIAIEFIGFVTKLFPHVNLTHTVQYYKSDIPLAKFASLEKIPFQLFPVSCILLN